MPKQITQFRVFIGSPGGLDEERRRFRDRLAKFTDHHGGHRNVQFHPVGWDDTIGGIGRPQALINEDLKDCDYAVFVLHDDWGAPAGTGSMVGIEEAWALAEQLYQAHKIRNIALFFKQVDPRRLGDPDPQLGRVLAFKQQIETAQRYRFDHYETVDHFDEAIDAALARWLKDHGTSVKGLDAGSPAASPGIGGRPINPPRFDYWITEAERLLAADPPELAGASFCAMKAAAMASSDLDWARTANVGGRIDLRLGRPDQAIIAFTAIADRFSASIEPDRRAWHAKALHNKGVSLGQLGRSAEEIAAYDDVVARFGAESEPALRDMVAKALVNKSERLGQLGRSPEKITVYDDLVARFGTASEPALRERVARALVHKGVALGQLGHNAEEIAVYDEVVARFGTASKPALREQVANALFNKGVILDQLGRRAEEIAVYDEVVARFGTAGEPALREQVARALVKKGMMLGDIGRGTEAIAAYDDVVARFGTASEPALVEMVAKARRRSSSLRKKDRNAAGAIPGVEGI